MLLCLLLAGVATAATWIVSDAVEREEVELALAEAWPGHALELTEAARGGVDDTVIVWVDGGVLVLEVDGVERRQLAGDALTQVVLVRSWLRSPSVAAPPPLPEVGSSEVTDSPEAVPPEVEPGPFLSLGGGPGWRVEGGGTMRLTGVIHGQVSAGWRGTGWSLGAGLGAQVGEVGELDAAAREELGGDYAVQRRRLDGVAMLGRQLIWSPELEAELRAGLLVQSVRTHVVVDVFDDDLDTLWGAVLGYHLRAAPRPSGVAPAGDFELRWAGPGGPTGGAGDGSSTAPEGLSVLLRLGFDLGGWP